MFQKLFTVVLLIFSLSIFSFAQNNNDTTQNKQPKPVKQKKNKKFGKFFGIGIMDLNHFLPEGENAWTLSLTSSGGFAGITRLLAAVNSNGNYLCSPNDEFRNRLLELDVLDGIFDFVETVDYSTFNQNKDSEIKGCMDCSYTTLMLQTKNGSISRTQVSFSNVENDVKRIYDRLSNLDECR
jgi:hypothetical protein